MEQQTEYVGDDLGFGNGKVRDKRGGTVFASHIARPGIDYRVDDNKMDGETSLIEFENKRYVVGKDAPISGQLLPGLDTERILGSNEIRAATYATWGAHMRQFGKWRQPLTIYAGVPASLMIGKDKDANVARIREWMGGEHKWQQDGERYTVKVEDVIVRSQAAGAISDMAYTLEGKQNRDAQYVESGFGAISVGYNTIETSGGIGGKPIADMISSHRYGVSSLLNNYDRNGKYEIPVLDWKLRRDQLNGHLSDVIDDWAETIVSHVAGKWEKNINLIERIILVGGGAKYAEGALRKRFGDKIWIPDDPIISIASGLLKRAMYDANAAGLLKRMDRNAKAK